MSARCREEQRQTDSCSRETSGPIQDGHAEEGDAEEHRELVAEHRSNGVHRASGQSHADPDRRSATASRICRRRVEISHTAERMRRQASHITAARRENSFARGSCRSTILSAEAPGPLTRCLLSEDLRWSVENSRAPSRQDRQGPRRKETRLGLDWCTETSRARSRPRVSVDQRTGRESARSPTCSCLATDVPRLSRLTFRSFPRAPLRLRRFFTLGGYLEIEQKYASWWRGPIQMRKASDITTIKQVAKAAGVSPTTVSHVLNNRGRVAEPTRIRVLEVVQELSYRSNRHAQQLVTRRSRILALQLPLTSSTSKQPTFPHSGYYLELINGATTAADELDYALIVVPAGGNGARNSMVDFAVDGAILVDPEGTEHVFDVPIQIATIGVPLQVTRPVASVDNDHGAAARRMLEHFESVGRTRPLLVADRTHRSYVRDLVVGYKSHTRARDADALVHRVTSLSKTAFDRALDVASENGSDAILASSDDIALGLLNRARHRDIAVPDQIVLASAVDAPALKLTAPQITATNHFPLRTGAAAVRQLVERLEHVEELGATATLERIPSRLIRRDSTNPRR